MSDFSHVTPRTKKIKARSFNTMLDAARFYQMLSKRSGSRPVELPLGVLVDVMNTGGSGEDVVRSGILGITGALISPLDNLEEFQSRVALSCTPSTDPTIHAGRFVVTVEPIAGGAVGRAFAFGACPVKVDITDTTHLFAEVDENNNDWLMSSQEGSARILTSNGATGIQWCYVLLTGVPGVLCSDASSS